MARGSRRRRKIWRRRMPAPAAVNPIGNAHALMRVSEPTAVATTTMPTSAYAMVAEDFRPADRPIRVLHLCRGQPPGSPMATTRQGQPASGVDLQALRLRRMTVPSAPFHRLNIYRRAEVAIDPVAGIGLLAREFESRDRSFLRGHEARRPRLQGAVEIGCQGMRCERKCKANAISQLVGLARDACVDESASTRCRTRLGRNRVNRRGARAIALLYAS